MNGVTFIIVVIASVVFLNVIFRLVSSHANKLINQQVNSARVSASPVRAYTQDRIYPIVPGSDFERKKIMTEHEKKFFALLLANTPKDCRIFAQVALNQLVRVRDLPDHKRKGKNIAFLKDKSVDFVVCDDQNNIIFAIELDDSSHDTARQKTRDDEKTFALDNAGIRLKRFRGIPDGKKIQELFENLDNYGVEVVPDLHNSVRTDNRITRTCAHYPLDKDSGSSEDNFSNALILSAAGMNYFHEGGLPVSLSGGGGFDNSFDNGLALAAAGVNYAHEGGLPVSLSGDDGFGNSFDSDFGGSFDSGFDSSFDSGFDSSFDSGFDNKI